MTEIRRQRLELKIVEWREKASHVGPMHSLWDIIFDAEAWLAGKPTIMKGSRDEVFTRLMEIEE